jgi:3-hydroxyacyl-CoA dehydrogenase
LAARVAVVPALTAAPPGPDLILEAGPEKLTVKQAIFADARAWAGPEPVLATTSSALTISEIVPDPADRRHCLVAHCANPPTIVRVVECVPAPETAPETVDRAVALLTDCGFLPVRVHREIPGFVFNRLQSALLREAYRLVRAGVVDAVGLDTLVAEGLGPRWALSGPFETAELNTPGGIKAHAARMGPAYRAIGEANGERDADWPDALVDTVDRQRRAVLPADRLPARVDWRRRSLARLMAARRDLMADWAETDSDA